MKSTDKGENAEKGRALRNTAQKERDTDRTVEEQKKDDCVMNRDVGYVRLDFTWKFSVVLNAITFTQAN